MNSPVYLVQKKHKWRECTMHHNPAAKQRLFGNPGIGIGVERRRIAYTGVVDLRSSSRRRPCLGRSLSLQVCENSTERFTRSTQRSFGMSLTPMVDAHRIPDSPFPSCTPQRTAPSAQHLSRAMRQATERLSRRRGSVSQEWARVGRSIPRASEEKSGE